MSDNSFAGINFDDPESKSIFENHKNTMCPSFKTVNESGFVVTLNVKKNDENNSFVVTGSIDAIHPDKSIYVKYSAANPPTYNSNFSGSGLPYPNEDIAYENTPNRGVAKVVNGQFSFSLKYPNSYYVNLGTNYVQPHAKLLIVNQDNKPLSEIQVVNFGEGIPFRTLTWPKIRDWNKGPMFYNNPDLPVRTQYQILLDSAYPITNTMPKNFWGTRPSV